MRARGYFSVHEALGNLVFPGVSTSQGSLIFPNVNLGGFAFGFRIRIGGEVAASRAAARMSWSPSHPAGALSGVRHEMCQHGGSSLRLSPEVLPRSNEQRRIDHQGNRALVTEDQGGFVTPTTVGPVVYLAQPNVRVGLASTRHIASAPGRRCPQAILCGSPFAGGRAREDLAGAVSAVRRCNAPSGVEG